MLVPWLDVDATFAEMAAIGRRMDTLLGNRGLDGRHGLRDLDGPGGSFVEDREGTARFVADLPGVARSDLQITVENGTLAIDVKRGDSAPEGWHARYVERRPYELRRVFRLPDDIDHDAITASIEHGVLTVALPRKPKAPARTIEVRTA